MRTLQKNFLVILTFSVLSTLSCSNISNNSIEQPALKVQNNELESIVTNLACNKIYKLAGDPSFHGAMKGSICIIDINAPAIILRVYDDPEATSKLIDDWRPMLSNENQMVYGNSWFATGSPDMLKEIFRNLPKNGPDTNGPTPTRSQASEVNIAVCSSDLYSEIFRSIEQQDAPPNNSMNSVYPGYSDIVRSIAFKAQKDNITIQSPDRLDLEVMATPYDAEIKSFCKSTIF